jgi:DNA-binding MarR family transcriptional regulator
VDPDQLAEAFWAVARTLRRRTHTALIPLDVTPGQARALAILAREGATRPGALAEHLHIAARSATEVVDALEGAGLVVRLADPDDRRATLVHLTAAGARAAEQVAAARAAAAAELFARLDPADRAELARLLAALDDTPAVRPDGRLDRSPRGTGTMGA